MNRKEFLRNCACAATASALLPSTGLAATGTKPPEDWRLPFVKQRYARLLEILAEQLDEKALKDTLIALGAYCSGLSDETKIKFRGNLEGYRQAIRQSVSGDNITYDWERGVITMASDERTDCFCPLISRLSHTPEVACNCSLGWQQHTWETLLQKPVKVVLKESVLRGGKRCVFEIHVGARAADAGAATEAG
jgi:hypothetical protein